MPAIRLAPETNTHLWRVLLNGAPGMWKTTSLLSLPKPVGIVVSPGEKQYRTIPDDDPEIISFRFSPEKDSHAMVREVEKICMELITGKYGKIQSFAFDGFHKYLEYVMDSISDGAWFRGEDIDPKLYTPGYRAAEAFLSKIQGHTLPWTVVTCWDGDKTERKAKPGEKAGDVPTYINPGLIGQMARRIMGEFPVILHASKRRPTPDLQKFFGLSDKEVVLWQTRPQGDIHGCSIRGRKEIVAQIPTLIPASYSMLAELWAKAEKEVNLQKESSK